MSGPTASSTAASSSPDRTSSSTAASSGDIHRSGPGPGTRERRAANAAAVPAAGVRRSPQIEPPRRARQLDGHDPRQIRDTNPELARRPPTHRHVVLLHRAGRQRVDARRRRQPAVLRHQRGLGVAGDHHSRVDSRIRSQEGRQSVRPRGVQQAVGAPLGDRAHLRRCDRQHIARHPDRRPVEVAARLDPPVRQNHRVIDCRPKLDVGHTTSEPKSVPRSTDHLRRAPQRVRVLNPGVAIPVAGDDR